MMRIIACILLALPLFATNLLDYKLYDRSDRLDLQLIFDSAYVGVVSQSQKENSILLTFNELNYKTQKQELLSSKFVKEILIVPGENKVQIMLQTQKKVQVNLSSLEDKKSYRIRLVDEENTLKEQIIQSASPQTSAPASNKLDFDYTQYILILGALILILIALWILKRYALGRSGEAKDFKIIFQRALDKNNQFIVIEYAKKRYTLVTGSSNTLLDVYENTQRQDKDDEKSFDSVFEENKQKIQDLIKKKAFD